MKKINLFIITGLLLLTATACQKQFKSFSTLQDEEDALIENYIKENNLEIVTSMPEEDVWADNLYYKTPSGLYFHMIKKGEVEGDTIKNGSNVGFRFIEYELDKKQTVRFRNWEVRDFEFPSMMLYGSNSAIADFGAGFYEGIGLMKYRYAEAKIIIPSDLNTDIYISDRSRLITVMHHIRITVIE